MHLERQTVSRKTPGDGRLEIGAQTADQLRSLGAELHASRDGLRAPAAVENMSCTCHGKETPHQHHFLRSTLFAQLKPGSTVDLDLDAQAGVVRVIEAPSIG
jgi:hypothetical protein